MRQLALLLLVAPVAAAGAVFWALPYVVTRRVAARFRPKLDQVATYKLSVGMLAFTIWLGLVAAAGWWTLGWRAVVAVCVSSQVAGLATIAWRERGLIALEDARLFLRVRGRGRSRRRLAEQRERLVAEFDAIAREWKSGVAGPVDARGMTR